MSKAKLVLLVVLLLLGSWAWWHNQHSPAQQPAGQLAPPSELDYFVDSFSVTTMTTSGKPARTLSADRMEHFRDTKITRLEQPQLHIYHESSAVWEVTSDQGELSADGDTLLLLGQVEIDRPAAPGIRPMHISTSNLQVRTNQDYAETAETVKITSNTGWVQGVGMQAWLREPSRIKFLSQTRAHYEVQ